MIVGSKKIDLDFPLDGGLNNVNIRRPKVRDQLASAKVVGGDEEKEVALFANLCEISPEEIAEMDMYDYKKLQKAYTGFLSSAKMKPEKAA